MKKTDYSIRWLTVCAVLMAINIVMSSSVCSIPVPGGHLYLNDAIICTAAILLDPLGAFAVGGIGAFLGDFLFYPDPMFVSLATHGLQAVVVSLCVRKLFTMRGERGALAAAIVGVIIGALINVAGYSLGRAYVYRTPAEALLKLPFQFLQAGVGSAAAVVLCFPCGLRKAFHRIMKQMA